MSLTDDTQRHIQTRLDFSAELTGEAREARRERLNRPGRSMDTNAQLEPTD